MKYSRMVHGILDRYHILQLPDSDTKVNHGLILSLADSQFPIMSVITSTTNALLFVSNININPDTWIHALEKTLDHIESFRSMWSGMWILCHVANPTGTLPGPFILYDKKPKLGPGRGSVWCLRMTKPKFSPSVTCVMRLVLSECSNHFSLILWIFLLSH